MPRSFEEKDLVGKLLKGEDCPFFHLSYCLHKSSVWCINIGKKEKDEWMSECKHILSLVSL